jgi:replicative DNA helicase
MSEKILDTLKKFGQDFQTKCISGLLSDRSFIERLSDIIDPTCFENDAHQWIIKEIMKYFVEKKDLPTLTVFKVRIEQIENELLKKSVIDQLKSAYTKLSDTDLNFVKEQFIEFCKNQKIKAALLESVEHLKIGDYEHIKKSFDEALKAGMERNVGHDYHIEIEKRMSAMSRESIKTNWKEIDDLMDGGLAKGELGVICSAAGLGKSWLLARIGAEAMRQGKNVLHVTLELNENYVGLRYDSCFTGIDFRNIKTNIDLVRKKICGIPGKLFIKYFPIKTVSPNSLKLHIERIQMLGTKIDLLVVDYADILRPAHSERNSNSYAEAGSIYEELRSVGGQLGLPIWTASQTNRQSSEEDVVMAHSISDSFRKIMTADFVMSLSRKTSDKIAKTARMHIIKNRFGPDGITFPARMNADCGDIQIYKEDSQDGMRIMNEMGQEENIVKKAIFGKFNLLMNSAEKDPNNSAKDYFVNVNV